VVGQCTIMVRATPIKRRWDEDLMGGIRLSAARERRGGLGRLTLMDRWEELCRRRKEARTLGWIGRDIRDREGV
jgi:hypothetical protein